MNKTNKSSNKLNVIQLNKSHSNFAMKQHEIHATITSNNAHVSIISKYNTGNENPAQIIEKNNLFDKYRFENKPIFNDKISRISLIIHTDIIYTRRADLEHADTLCNRSEDLSKEIANGDQLLQTMETP